MIEGSSREPESMDILYLLERLEEVLGAGRRVPFTNHTLIDDEECLAIIDQIRLSIPNEIRQARKINADRESILDEARMRAEQILRAADEEARERVRDHPIARQAEAHADELISQAERRGAQVRQEADDYAYRVLQELDRRLETLTTTVRNGLRALQPGHDQGGPDYDDFDRSAESDLR
jgi:vacuolar-type H+-ATPase subunit H